MRVIRVWLLVVAVGSIGNGCSCEHAAGNGGDGGELDMSINPDAIAGGDIVIMPKDVTLDLQAGGTPPSQAYTAQTLAGMDVTAMTTFTVDDATLGTFNGATFIASGTHGGSTFVRGNFQGMTGYATLHVKLHASVGDTCPGCPAFPGSGTPACTATAMTPIILDPNDGALVPPNTNVMQLQFDQGTGNTYFEIDWENAATDVRVLTQCTPITDSKGNATNGCVYDLSQQVWDYIAQSNRGGDPLNIIVRATDANGTCVATSQNQVAISFGEDDLNGGVYYWQSVAIGVAAGAAGGIFRYDFGKRGQTPEAFLAPIPGAKMNRCIGCHFLSRDGVKMTYGNDDPDADDEYSDLRTNLLDVATKTATAIGSPGFQAFTPDHSLFLASDGLAALSKAFYLFNGTSGAAASPATVSSGPGRATQPDYSADGSQVVFVVSDNYIAIPGKGLYDNHFAGGSLYLMTANGTTFGTPTALVTSAGENNYYPAFSPDGAFVVFNRVPLTGTIATSCVNTSTPAGSCPNDAFSNPNARIFIVPTGGGTPVDLANVNGAGPLENSWPRFAPTVQKYKGDTIAWITFASTRDYGDVVRNSSMVNGMAQHLCYPPESPENASTNKNVIEDPSCLQPQLWMAAIDLTKAAQGGDPSFPAFWLPFQDAKAHNHIAQWVVQIVGAPGGDGGMCLPDNAPCTTGSNCCNGVCCGNNVCGCIP